MRNGDLKILSDRSGGFRIMQCVRIGEFSTRGKFECIATASTRSGAVDKASYVAQVARTTLFAEDGEAVLQDCRAAEPTALGS